MFFLVCHARKWGAQGDQPTGGSYFYANSGGNGLDARSLRFGE
jgi:hypothetical protein